MYLLNAFSLSMLADPASVVTFKECSAAKAAGMLAGGFKSAVGHADTAALFATLLGVDVPVNRVSVTLPVGEWSIVGQYSGPRLPEGCTALPEGATVRWMQVRVNLTHKG